MPPDVLYRVRAGKNESLRYSLRSLENVPHGDVFMVGWPPSWVANVNVITPRMWRTKWRALTGDLLTACRELGSRKLILIDDDMFIVSPRKSIKPLHGGDLRQSADRKLGTYGRTMHWTADYLEGLGITKPLSYELHVPLEIEADAMVEALAPVNDARRPIQARSIYGNVHGIKGTLAPDVKVRQGEMPADYLSTSPQSWRYWQPKLEALFPERSAYEH